MQLLLLRYYDPVHGKVTFDGQGMFVGPECECDSTACVDIREFNPSSWRNIIGIVPQVRSTVNPLSP